VLIITGLAASLLLVLAYSWRDQFRVAVGEFGDGPYLSGFNADEPGAPRYRWTGGSRIKDGQTSALVNFPFVPSPGADNRVRLSVGAALAKDSGQKAPPVVTILANGIEIGQAQTAEGVQQNYEFNIPANALRNDYFLIELRSPVFQAGGRQLGVKVQEVTLLTAPALRLPPFEVWFWSVTFALSAALIALKLWHSRYWLAAGLGNLVFLLLLALPWLVPRNVNLWYGPSNSTPYLAQVAAWIMLALCAIAWVKEIGLWLWEFPEKLEGGQLARNILLAASLLYFVYAFAVIWQMDFIGHADYADNAVVARNFVRGNGLSADYAAQFYTRYNLPRPADTWPLLQPLMIAPFFLALGPSAFAAKLPNLIIMLALTWGVFRWGSRYFNRKTGLIAALLTLLAPALWETVVYPINDLAFTLFAFLALMNLYRAATYRPMENAPVIDFPPVNPFLRVYGWLTQAYQRLWLWAGLWSGLLLWSKPSGAVILVAAGLWVLYEKFLNKELTIRWKGLFLWTGLTLLIIAPYLLRGMWLEGTPLYSTERYDAWILGYAPWERIYDLYYPENKPLPEPRLLLSYGWDTVLKVKYNQFRNGIEDFMSGAYIAPLVWVFGLGGLFGLSRRRYGLLGLLVSVFTVYLLFINLYWHYEIRYFMVWLPWFFLFGAFGLSWIYQKMREQSPSSMPGRLGVWLLVAGLAVMLLPNIPQITDAAYTGRTGIVITSDWIKTSLPRNAVIMTRVPWQLSFHAERNSVMIPNNIMQLEQLRPILQDYKVTHLQLNYLDTGDTLWRERPALFKLINREPVQGFKLVYQQGDFLVYEISPEFIRGNS
jgi:4-amino-4-deoxy-L-arabinose transferase-like glycosyltransferase